MTHCSMEYSCKRGRKIIKNGQEPNNKEKKEGRALNKVQRKGPSNEINEKTPLKKKKLKYH